MSVGIETSRWDSPTRADAVRSRISWGAIVAGAAVALAIFTLLTLLGAAVGLSVSDDVERDTLGTGAGIWTFLSLVFSLFVGGWVTTKCTLGETRTEAILYGVVLWAVTSTLLLFLTAGGLRLGMDTLVTAQQVQPRSISDISAETGDSIQQTSAQERRESVERARDQGKTASWWAFAGTLVSMIAAIGGALVGPYEFTARRDRDHHQDNVRHDRPLTTPPPAGV